MSENKQRSENTPEECAVIAKAWAEGKELQFYDYKGEWRARVNPDTEPSFSTTLYRVKPEPRTFELWVSPSGTHFTQRVDTRSVHICTQSGWTKINVKEIVD